MTPIHHSKLKAGDLVYVESSLLADNGNPVYIGLAQIIMKLPLTQPNQYPYFAIRGQGFPDQFICSTDHFFLIERGYFL